MKIYNILAIFYILNQAKTPDTLTVEEFSTYVDFKLALKKAVQDRDAKLEATAAEMGVTLGEKLSDNASEKQKQAFEAKIGKFNGVMNESDNSLIEFNARLDRATLHKITTFNGTTGSELNSLLEVIE